MPFQTVSSVLISETLPVQPVGGWTTESVTHGQCDARPIIIIIIIIIINEKI